MPNYATLKVIADWDDSKVRNGVQELSKFVKGGRLGSLSIGGDVTGVNNTKTAIQQLRAEVNASKMALESHRATVAMNDSEANRLQGTYNQLKAKLDSVTRATKGGEDAYARLSRITNEATRHAQNLGVQYGVNSDQFKIASGRALQLTETLKSVDAATGRNFRNVGNYASGYNAISVNMARIVGEMPNFAMSARLGFMAISNNIQPLSESISELKRKNAELIAQGQPAKSVLSQVGSALFSWNTLLMVGVTALTVYGPKLWEFIAGTDGAAEAQKRLNERKKELEAIDENAYKTAGKNIGQINSLLSVLENENSTYEAKSGALKKLQDLYPTTLGQLTLHDVKSGKLAETIKNILIPAIEAEARAMALADKIADNYSKRIDLKYKQSKAAVEYGKALADYNSKAAEALNKQKDYSMAPSMPGQAGEGFYNNKIASKEADAAWHNLVKKAKEYKDIRYQTIDLEKENAFYINEQKANISDINTAAKAGLSNFKDISTYLGNTKKNSPSYAVDGVNKYNEAVKDLMSNLELLNREFEGGFLGKEEFDKKKLDVLASAYKKFFVDLKQSKDTVFMQDLFANLVGAKSAVKIYEEKAKANEANAKAKEEIQKLAEKISEKQKKEIEDRIKADEQVYKQLLDNAQNYTQQKLNLDNAYFAQYRSLERQKGKISEEEYARQEKLIQDEYQRNLKNLKFNSSDLFRQLNKDIRNATLKELQEIYQYLDKAINSGKMKNGAGELVDIPPDLLKRMIEMRDNVKGLTGDIAKLKLESSDIGKIALGFGQVGKALQQIGSSLDSAGFDGSVIGNIGNMVATLSDSFIKINTAVQAFKKTLEITKSTATAAKELFSSKDLYGAIIQIIGIIINMFGSLKRYKESLAELQRNVNEKNVEIYLSEYKISDEQREQNLLKAKGIELTLKQLEATKKVLKENKKQIESETKALMDKINSEGEYITNSGVRNRTALGKLFGSKPEMVTDYGKIRYYNTNDVIEYAKSLGLAKDAYDKFVNYIKEQSKDGKIAGGFLDNLGRDSTTKNPIDSTPIDDLLYRLDKDGKRVKATFEDLKKLDASGLLTGETKKLYDQLAELEKKGIDVDNAMKEWQDQLNETLTGTTADNITNAIVKGFEDGKRTVEDFAGDFESLMKQAMLQSLKYQYLQAPISEFYKKFAEDANSGNELTQDEINALKDYYNKIISDANSQFENLKKITGVKFDTSGAGDENTLKGSIKASLTEDTGSILAGTFTGVHVALLDIRSFVMTDTKEFYDKSIQHSVNAMETLKLIKNDTGNIDTNTKDTVAVLKSIDSKMSNSANQARAAGF